MKINTKGKVLFLTSSPTVCPQGPINPANHFQDMLKQEFPEQAVCLFVSSDPDNIPRTEGYAEETKKMLEEAGLCFAGYTALDRRNQDQAEKLIRVANVLFLAGGHVPTENAFFQEIGLRNKLENFEGVIIAVSAGTMNSADVVYSQPELEGESIDPEYKRILTGLGLTDKMILPHYQYTKDLLLDGKRLFEDITYPDSMGRTFYALPDGTFLFSKDGEEQFCGTVYEIRDGKISKLQ